MLSDNILQIITFHAKRQNDCYLLTDSTSAEAAMLNPTIRIKLQIFHKTMSLYRIIKMNCLNDFSGTASVHKFQDLEGKAGKK